MTQDVPLIFVSHAESEAELVGRLVDRLKQVLPNVEFFVSSSDSLRPGAIWVDGIREALQRASIVVACVSRWSTDRPWIVFECGFGVGAGIPVIPVILDDLPYSALVAPLSVFTAVRLDNGGLVELVGSIAQETKAKVDKALLQREAASPVAPIPGPEGTLPGVYLGRTHHNIRVGWERYSGDHRTFETRRRYVSIGHSFSDAFRYPPRDSLMAPWHYFGFRIQRTQEVHMYVLLEHMTGSARKLYVSSIVNSWGFAGDPTDEFSVPLPPVPKGRWQVFLVDIRSLERDFESPVRGIIGFRVRGPLWLSHIWCVDDLADMPPHYLEAATQLSYPAR